ncbi:hypothetical protein [Nocardia sp. NPDC051832]|uniref:hypothetical protein n=1 Tax=Nocardia sp. NPDC051832 TaxID=3155673 RepID=UPI003445F833
MTEDDADGPLIRAAYRQAEAIDAEPGRSSASAKVRLVAWAAGAMAEGYLRSRLFVGGMLFSIVVVVMGVASDSSVWKAGYITVGLLGVSLLIGTWTRPVSFGRQWAVGVGVFGVDVILLATSSSTVL